jgi:hypothetical protein
MHQRSVFAAHCPQPLDSGRRAANAETVGGKLKAKRTGHSGRQCCCLGGWIGSPHTYVYKNVIFYSRQECPSIHPQPGAELCFIVFT